MNPYKTNIDISIKNKIATSPEDACIICGNNSYTATFTFDSEWDTESPIFARFVYSKFGVMLHSDVEIVDNVVDIPVLSDVTQVFVGVYSGNIKSTTPTKIKCKPSILCGYSQSDAWYLLQNQIGNLSHLETDNKDSLVEAINEVSKSKGITIMDDNDGNVIIK